MVIHCLIGVIIFFSFQGVHNGGVLNYSRFIGGKQCGTEYQTAGAVCVKPFHHIAKEAISGAVWKT